MVSTYKVEIRIKSDVPREQVISRIAHLFKTTEIQINQAFINTGFLFKHGLNLETAKKYQLALEECGCICLIEPESQYMEPSAPSSRPKEQARVIAMSSTEDSNNQPSPVELPTTWNVFSSATEGAAVFAGAFGMGLFMFFFVSILSMGLLFTNFSLTIVESIPKLLGFHETSSGIFISILFIVPIAFIILLIINLPIKMATARKAEKINSVGTGEVILIFVAMLVVMPLLIFHLRHEEAAVIEEQQLAVNFVKHNRQVFQLTGKSVSDNFPDFGHGKGSNKVWYKFTIDSDVIDESGEKTLFAIVDVSRSWGGPTFSLACITSNYLFMRSPIDDPCTDAHFKLTKSES